MGNVNLEENNYRTYMSYEDLQSLVTSKVRGSILWMVLGLIITGVTGFFFLNAVSNGIISNEIFGPIMIGAIVLEFVTVIAFTALTYKSSAGALRAMFLVYSVLNGVTLSTLGLAYGLDLVVIAFASTVVLFTVLAIYGYCTKEDLTKYTSLLTVGIISLIIMSLINIFLRSDGLMLITSIIGVIVFIIFIAVDVNRIKSNVIAYAMQEDASILDKIEIHGALQLYLDFINLFIYILRLLGRRR